MLFASLAKEMQLVKMKGKDAGNYLLCFQPEVAWSAITGAEGRHKHAKC